MIVIYFSEQGNTIIGGESHSVYKRFDDAMERKAVYLPEGCSIQAEDSDFRRLIEYVELFGHCIQTKEGFAHACKLADVQFFDAPECTKPYGCTVCICAKCSDELANY